MKTPRLLPALLALFLLTPCRFLEAQTADSVRGAAAPLVVDIKKDWIDQAREFVDILTLIGVVGGIFAFYTSRKDAKSTATLNRFEKYQNMQALYRTDSACISVRASFEAGVDSLRNEDPYKKYMFMAFFEDIALMLQSNLIQEDVAFYMFSYDAIRAWGEPAFWENIDKARDNPDWQLFYNFCTRMIKLREGKFQNTPRPVHKFRF